MNETVLKVENLNLELGNEPILQNIKCQIPKGKITVIVGPSGAGKSSLLKSMIKLLPATGNIYFNNKSINQLDLRDFRRKVIFVSQVPVVFPGTVSDNINWGRSVWDLPDCDVDRQLELVNLPTDIVDRDADDLSVGQQQRLHLARSLALNPEVLLLDEPASALDAISKEAFEDLIFRLQEDIEDLSVVMITHDLSQAKRMAEYAILLHQGKIKLQSNAESFFREVQDMSEAEMLQQLIGSEEELA